LVTAQRLGFHLTTLIARIARDLTRTDTTAPAPDNGFCAADHEPMGMKTAIELDAGARTFASSLLPELIDALRLSRPGDLVALTSSEPSIGAELETWCRFTGNTLIEMTVEAGRTGWVVRYGEAPANSDDRPVGLRLWLYTNFDCNLRCDYCCVRSSPRAPRRELGLKRIRRIAAEAAELGVGEIFVTGGEPFLLADISAILAACVAAAPTTVLTNGMLFVGRRGNRMHGRDHATPLRSTLDSADPSGSLRPPAARAR
jgi:uncharacterized radical SAM superfamily Fe-S cluster-containing enzyme